MQRPKLSDMEVITGQRNSLPDITTTPKEENGQFFTTSSLQVRTSHSIEDMLHDERDGPSRPPPKPTRYNVPTPPTIPPKKTRDSLDNNSSPFVFNAMKMSLERSKSPDMNSSIGSMGSMFNNSSNENDFNALGIEDVRFDINHSSSSSVKTSHMVESKFLSSFDQNRTSNESGFGSISSQSTIFKNHHHSQAIVENLNSTLMSSSHSHDEETPPPLPIKTKSRKYESQRSLYDNVEANESTSNSHLSVVTTSSSSNSSLASSSTITSFSNAFSHDFNTSVKNKYHSCFEPRNLMVADESLRIGDNGEDKPPLPPKKNKHSKFNFTKLLKCNLQK